MTLTVQPTGTALLKVRRLLGGVLFGLIAILAVYTLRDRLPDPAAFAGALRAADGRWAASAVAAGLLSQCAYAEQQRRLLAALGVRVPPRRALAMTYVRSALSMALPAGSAASAAYAFRTYRRHGATSATAATATLISSVVTVLALALLYAATWSLPVTGVVLLVAVPAGVLARRSAAVPAAGDGIRPGVVPPLASRAGRGVVAPLVSRAGRGVVAPLVSRAGRGVVALFTSRVGRWVVAPFAGLMRRPPSSRALSDARSIPLGTWLAVLTAGLINWLLDLSCLVLAAAAAHADVGWSRLALIYLAVQVVRQIPLTPGGIGLIETSMLAGLIAAGCPEITAATVVLIYRLISFWLILPTGVAAHFSLRNAVGPEPAAGPLPPSV
ncbi:flippase-like domain-containing protein [Actinoplanes palleronii]|uniref:lysylphosphatidylglycerol synthase transmembrane domain-containing protein n=3 Tax=Actinoplanes palleronii TaxID=113570 RepID=UPI0031D6E0DD